MSIAPIRTLRKRGGFRPFEQDFTYTGAVQSFTVPANGLYKLETWGAEGGYNGGKGGYSIGYKALTKGQTIYVVVGGAGSYTNGGAVDARNLYYCSGGYNGGGGGASAAIASGAGGGATHMATVTGTLSTIGKAEFDSKGLIVAGGGGGGGSKWQGDPVYGGSGGGTSGGNGTNGYGPGSSGTGGTQSSGAGFGIGGSAYVQGQEGSWFRQGAGGGGGGYYGGGGGRSTGYGSEGSNYSGGGGSGYIGGVPETTYKGHTYTPSTSNGVNSGNGKAKITRIA
jgi:hypothetical protein